MARQSPGNPVVTISERDSPQATTPTTTLYGSAARPLRPQIKDGVVLEYIHFQPFSTSGFPTQKQLILISYVNHLAFRGAHMHICDAKDCKCSLN